MSPAAAFAKSSNPQSEIRTPQSPAPSTSAFRVPRSNLLLDFLTGEVPVEVILADHNLTPDQFLAWIESAETQHQLDTLARIDAARAKAIAATSRADAMHSLRRVLVQSKSLGEIRRAASAILRYDGSKVPRPVGSEPTRGPIAPDSTPPPARRTPPAPASDTLAANLATITAFLAKADAPPPPPAAGSPAFRSGAASLESAPAPPPDTRAVAA